MRAISLFFILILSCLLSSGQTSKPLLRINSPMHTAAIRKVSVDASGKLILSCSNDKTARLWDGATGNLLNIFRPPTDESNGGMLYGCSISPDGVYAAVGGWTEFEDDDNFRVYLFDVKSGELIKQWGGYDNVVFDLEFSPDSKRLAVSRGGTNGIQIFDIETLGLVKALTDNKNDIYNLAFAQDGRLASVSYDGNLRIYNTEFELIKKTDALVGDNPFSLSFSPDGSKIAVGFDDTYKLQVLDSRTLKVLYEPDVTEADNASKRLEMVQFSPDGRYLYAGCTADRDYDGVWKKFIRRWALAGAGTYRDFETSDDTILDLKVAADGSLIVGSATPQLIKMNPSGTVIWEKRGEIFDLRARDKTHFRLNRTGTEIGFKPMHAGGPYIFQVNERQFAEKESTAPHYRENVGSTTITDWEGTRQPKKNGQLMNFLSSSEMCFSVDMTASANRLVFGTGWNIHCLNEKGEEKWKTPLPYPAWAVKISGDESLVTAAVGDGTFRWFRFSDGKLLLSLYINPSNDDWILWTPSGYYDCSPGAETLIGWHLNNGTQREAFFYPVSKFRQVYYRPDIVNLVLVKQDEEAAIAMANTEGNRKSLTSGVFQSLPPLVNIITPENGAELDNGKVKVSFKVTSPLDEPLTGWVVQVDGRPYETFKQAPATDASGISTVTVEINKNSTIGIMATNRHGYSEPASVNVLYNASMAKGVKLGPGAVPTETQDYMKPKLYALVVGVSAYSNPDLKLNLAAKDARDFAAALKQQKGGLYADVEVKLLSDAEASKNNILDGLEWLEKQVTQKDVGMIFLSGHGKDDNAGNFYYLPVGADLERMKSTCVNKSDIMGTIQNLSGKALLFMDACHSGSVGTQGRKGSVDMTALVNELIDAQNGAIVFTSSRGNQYSLENDSWGNGAFTKALLEGISGKAAIGENKITTLSLGSYVMERVKEITGGKQHPTFNQPPNQSAFPIAVKK